MIFSHFKKNIAADQEFIVVSFPKSGRTWLRVMLSDLGVHPIYDHVNSKFSMKVTPRSIRHGISSLFNNKIIFLRRDPKDVIVSAYFYYKYNKTAHTMDFQDYIRSEETGIERIYSFNNYYLKHKNKFSAFLDIEYEEMHINTIGTVQSCLEFMGTHHISTKKISEVVDAHNFSKMQKNELSGELHEKYGKSMFSVPKNQDVKALKVRKGQVGDHKIYMNSEDFSYCRELEKKYFI